MSSYSTLPLSTRAWLQRRHASRIRSRAIARIKSYLPNRRPHNLRKVAAAIRMRDYFRNRKLFYRPIERARRLVKQRKASVSYHLRRNGVAPDLIREINSFY